MNFVLDTNIVLDYLKAGKITDFLIEQYNFLAPEHNLVISSVTIGELHSLACNAIGAKKESANS